INEAIEVVEATCGIATIRDIQKQFESLAEYGLYGSKFSRLESPKKTYDPFTISSMWMLPEKTSLTLPTSDAVRKVTGWPFKIYPAYRYFDPNGGAKSFRLAIVRRMFVSEIQLGYRLVFHVLGSKQSSTEVVLTTYNTPGIKGDRSPLPSKLQHPPPDVVVNDATLYDVVQNKLFSIEDEDQSQSGHPHPDRERLFIHPRQGKVSIRIEVDFQLDLNDPAWPYIGYAN